MYITIVIILIIISLLELAVGIASVLNPSLVISLQQAFYKKINWYIQPISIEREIRNTKFMGYVDFLMGLLIFFLAIRFSLEFLF